VYIQLIDKKIAIQKYNCYYNKFDKKEGKTVYMKYWF